MARQQVTIGPVIENGFYYDFFRNEPFTPEDSRRSSKDARDHRPRQTPHQGGVVAREVKRVFRDKGETFKVELVEAIPDDQEIKSTSRASGSTCAAALYDLDRQVGNAFKLMKVAGAYWRGDARNPMLTRIYGTACTRQEELDAYLKQLEEAEKRDHRRLGREMNLFTSRKKPRARCSGIQRAGRCSRRWKLHPPPAGRGRLCRGQLAATHG